MYKIAIITYHYVRPIKDSQFPQLKGLEFKKFVNQLNKLKKIYKFISYDDLMNCLKKKEKLANNSLLLTFDDGYKDHYKYVYPELKKRGIKGCFFPTIQSSKYQKVLDVNKIHFILAKVNDPQILIKKISEIIDNFKKLKKKYKYLNIEKVKKNFTNTNRFDDKDTSFIKFLLQRKLPKDLRVYCCKRLFNLFVSKNEKTFASKLYMSLRDIKILKDNGMHIGAHGNLHIRLAELNYKQQHIYLKKNLKFLKEINVPTKDWSICYPHGSYNSDTLKVLKKLKCLFGFTIKKGKATISSYESLKLKRFDCNDFL
jgi:peptidoglycan/xylan/chitin deacetylase (PgdA/CDA1 family)